MVVTDSAVVAVVSVSVTEEDEADDCVGDREEDGTVELAAEDEATDDEVGVADDVLCAALEVWVLEDSEVADDAVALDWVALLLSAEDAVALDGATELLGATEA